MITTTTTDSREIRFNTQSHVTIYREQYEEDLRRRQKEHLDSIQQRLNHNWQPCLHDGCPSCHGTGIKHDGSMCVHHISCSCPKCSPRY